MRSYQPKTNKQRQIIKDWIARLRNPNSRRTECMLKANKGNGYCCLGHLCKVVGLKFVRFKNSFGGYGHYMADEESKLLPESVMKLLDLPQDPSVCIGDQTYELAELNDIEEFTLREIADVVEADWIKGKPLKSHKKLENI